MCMFVCVCPTPLLGQGDWRSIGVCVCVRVCVCESV